MPTLRSLIIWLILTWELKYSSKEKVKKKKVELILKQGIKAPVTHLYWGLKKVSWRACLFFCFWWQKKNRLKKLLPPTLSSFVFKFIWFTYLWFRIDTKIHTKIAIDVSRDVGRKRKVSRINMCRGQMTNLGEEFFWRN